MLCPPAWNRWRCSNACAARLPGHVRAWREYRDDCRHVALASVTGVDLLVSWNFRHIVQYDKIRKFNAVNMLRGYPTLEIRSPLEVIYHE